MFKGEDMMAQAKSVEKILRTDISREIPRVGETEVIMQRHEKYIRDENDERSGSLEPEDAQKSFDQAVEILESKLKDLSKEDRKSVDILVISSDTEYGKNGGMRSFETAAAIIDGIRSVFEKYGLSQDQLLNSKSLVSKKSDTVLPSKSKSIQEPRIFKDSPEFVNYLKIKYGDLTQKFWQAFEEDWERDKRVEMAAEGPKDILDRYVKFIEILKNFSVFYHKKHPKRRLIIWPVSHYDTLSPYIKNKITSDDPKKYLPIDYGAGISLKINQSGKMTSKIHGNEYEIN